MTGSRPRGPWWLSDYEPLIRRVRARWRGTEKGYLCPRAPLTGSVSPLSVQTAPSPELSQGPMARDRAHPCEVDQEKYDADDNVKIICLGDSAVGKSKYVGKRGEKGGAQGGSELPEECSGGAVEHGFRGRHESSLAGAQVCTGEVGRLGDHISTCGRSSRRTKEVELFHEYWQTVWSRSP